MGTSVYMQTGVNLGYANGTSFSSPLVAGAATSLWSAFPSVTAIQVKQALELSSHLQLAPNDRLGFGIPDFQKAYNYLMNLSSSKLKAEKNWRVFPNPASVKLTLQRNSGLDGKTEISIFSADGKLLVRQTFSGQNIIVLEGLNSLPVGILILKISSVGETETFKISKI
jgi:subtilisin family serine protease